ncbi:glycosyl transferase [Pseudorhizobium endolithicum]|uniref:Glycosyl transferase n=1 Tax=Pseudorhizobium endolithicum TaxID=1191678 RepID=A0ABM8PRG4_9HYPH|nr:glycosyltransferase [Pseudorhizobium endolithicum]CAD7044499.1 glycosyl transferase [Pseudorhizobium endolithicum]
MKIVHVIASIDPKFGGPQAVVQRIAAAQAALGHDVHIVSYCNTDVAKQVLTLGGNIPAFDGINWHIIPEARMLERLLCLRGLKRLHMVLENASFLHLHGVWDPFLLWAASMGRQRKVPYCICTSGMLDVWSMEQKRLKKRLAFLLGYRRMLDSAAFLHALNADEVELMKPLKLAAPAAIIPNGIFPQEFGEMPPKGSFQQKIGLASHRRYILFLSRLHFKKGLDILAGAFAVLAPVLLDVDLVVAGPPDGAEDEFAQLIREAGLEQRVHMVGPLYGQDKLAALNDAHCFCLPSRQEGFSIAITEALACAIPVVITESCHFPEVSAQKAGLVVPAQPREVAFALKTVLEDTAMARAMGQNGRQLVMENYVWPAIANATLRNYSKYTDRGHDHKPQAPSSTTSETAAGSAV